MPNTYTQLHVQIVFAVQHRESLIHERFREKVQRYMTGIVQKHRHKLLAIYCMPDHCHLLVGLHPSQSISDLVREVKTSTTHFVNQNRLTPFHFAFQGGYGAFSYSKSQVPSVIRYVLNQPEHHKKASFKEEYLGILKKYDASYDEAYLFDWLEA